MAAIPGHVAVDPRQFPYGTRLYIMSGNYVYGYAVAADTGGFVYNGSGVTVDLFFGSNAEAKHFGRRPVDIYVVS
jgi:3D (Asp-Asp-Asp) domain-containing protein